MLKNGVVEYNDVDVDNVYVDTSLNVKTDELEVDIAPWYREVVNSKHCSVSFFEKIDGVVHGNRTYNKVEVVYFVSLNVEMDVLVDGVVEYNKVELEYKIEV